MTRSMLFASVSLVAALALGVAYAQTPPAGGQQGRESAESATIVSHCTFSLNPTPRR